MATGGGGDTAALQSRFQAAAKINDPPQSCGVLAARGLAGGRGCWSSSWLTANGEQGLPHSRPIFLTSSVDVFLTGAALLLETIIVSDSKIR